MSSNFIIDYPRCSSEILSIPIDTKDFNINYVYRIFGNTAFNKNFSDSISNGSIRNNIYMELFYPSKNPIVYYVYSTYSLKNQISTVVASDLDIPNYIIINDKRIWVMDRIIIFPEELPEGIISVISFPFKNNNNINCNLRYAATLFVINQDLYSEVKVNRNSMFIYYPETTVFMLINKSNLTKIYIMFALSNTIDTNLNTFNAQYLNSKLDLPEGWLFTTMTLDNNTYLKVVAKDFATVIKDNLNNTYQYLEPKYAPWLYYLYPFVF
jgi:hypothetical protein